MSAQTKEIFRAEPMRTEAAWRVLGSRGTLAGFRLSKEYAEDLARRLNQLGKRDGRQKEDE